ncbi:MAG: hypothetical protein IIW40_02540, partial [Clostridia bacterium]|nr:hypothetical protein [Clostridia bacterium]
MYGKMGVCCVEDKRAVTFGGDMGEYYVLRPMSDSRSVVYVPCDNDTLVERMRPLLSREEIEALLSGVGEEELKWIEDKDERRTVFREVLAQGDRRQLLLMIRCLYGKKQEKQSGNKRLATSDEVLFQEAVRLLEEEIAEVLQIPREMVAEYIRSRLE